MQTLSKHKNKIAELADRDISYTSVRVSRKTADAIAARGKFRDTFEDILKRLLIETDNKLQHYSGGSF